MALPASDSWNQNTGSTQFITAYGAYTMLEGTITIPTGNVSTYVPDGGTYNTARRNNETWAADQYSQVTITGSGYYSGPMVRGQSGANTSYHVETNGSGYYLSKCVAGTQTTLDGPISQTWNAGDIIRLEVTGSGGSVTLKVFHAPAANPTVFTQAGSDYVDSSSPITTAGQAGVFTYGSASNDGAGPWSAGNLGGGGGGISIPVVQGYRRMMGMR